MNPVIKICKGWGVGVGGNIQNERVAQKRILPHCKFQRPLKIGGETHESEKAKHVGA
jgi:hypothetical protein